MSPAAGVIEIPKQIVVRLTAQCDGTLVQAGFRLVQKAEFTGEGFV
jgi:hypothetical protein